MNIEELLLTIVSSSPMENRFLCLVRMQIYCPIQAAWKQELARWSDVPVRGPISLIHDVLLSTIQ